MFSDFFNNNEEKIPSKILDNLYLGNSSDSENLESLYKLNIKYILITGKYLKAKFPHKFKYKHFKVDDNTYEDIEKYFNEAYEFIKEGIKAGGCLVHCAAGVSRSPAFVIAFLMKDNMWTLNEAFNYVYKRRPLVYPNYGFQKQLKKYEADLGLITLEDYEKEMKSDKIFLIDLID